jgi:hypothetical protein
MFSRSNRVSTIIVGLGILVAMVPLTGFPFVWKNFLSYVLGLVIVAMAIIGRQKKTSDKLVVEVLEENKTNNFVGNYTNDIVSVPFSEKEEEEIMVKKTNHVRKYKNAEQPVEGAIYNSLDDAIVGIDNNNYDTNGRSR